MRRSIVGSDRSRFKTGRDIINWGGARPGTSDEAILDGDSTESALRLIMEAFAKAGSVLERLASVIRWRVSDCCRSSFRLSRLKVDKSEGESNG